MCLPRDSQNFSHCHEYLPPPKHTGSADLWTLLYLIFLGDLFLSSGCYEGVQGLMLTLHNVNSYWQKEQRISTFYLLNILFSVLPGRERP